ncbi:MAG: hypothetical protein EPN22_05800 [Nitrospirae bacterium]|nr:MAG: hypothetical protein EPN22_05800 [Nitrospirota bacterium]
MNAVKEQAISLIKTLSEDCTYEDIQYHLYVLEKVEKGIKAIDEGKFVSQDEAEKRVRTWLASRGQTLH